MAKKKEASVFQPKSQTMTTSRKGATRDSAVTILTSGCHFSGKLFCRGSSRIAGRIEGQLVSEGLLIIEEEAVITADIQADEVIVQGRISGTLKANARVELAPSCSVDGDIEASQLTVHEGARFNGRCTMPEKVADADIKGRKGKGKGDNVNVVPVPDVKLTQ